MMTVDKQKFAIIVNTRTKEWNGEFITYREVVDLAYPPPHKPTEVFTVQYMDGPPQNPQGSLVEGHKVRVKDEMVFIVDRTDRS